MINNLTFVNTSVEQNALYLEERLKTLDQENQKLKTKLALYESGSKYRDSIDNNFDIKDLQSLKQLIDISYENVTDIEKDYHNLLEQDFNFKKTVILKYEELIKEIGADQYNGLSLIKRKKREDV
jgi:hypothetical protein